VDLCDGQNQTSGLTCGQEVLKSLGFKEVNELLLLNLKSEIRVMRRPTPSFFLHSGEFDSGRFCSDGTRLYLSRLCLLGSSQ